MEFLKQHELLYKKARADFKAAKNLFEDFENGDEDLELETILFHLQQCGEKLFKSLLSYNKKHFTKTHDLDSLLQELKNNNIQLLEGMEELLQLSEYAVEGRYAIMHDDLEDTNKFIVILDDFLEFVKQEIGK